MSIAESPLDGRILNSSSMELFKYKREFAAVVVTGDGINGCGHMLLNVGGRYGYYVHIAGTRAYPKLLEWHQYGTYLSGNRKKELFRQTVYVPFADTMMTFIEKSMSELWQWLGPIHNCATFVEKAFYAGGVPMHTLANCPILKSTTGVPISGFPNE